MIKDVSFCILNYGHSYTSLQRCIRSIHGQNMPEYEILVCSFEGKEDNVRYFLQEDWARQGAINKMRNLLCNQATKAHIVLIEANVELLENWYARIKHADYFDLISSRLITPDNKRAVDWAYQFELGNETLPLPLEYDEWTTKAYISGSLMVVRREVWEEVKFSEDLPVGQNDEADFCLQASEIGFRCGAFPEAVAICHSSQSAFQQRKYLAFDEPVTKVTNFRSVFAEGQNAYNGGDYGRALYYLQKVVEIVPEEALVWGYIGWSHYYKTKYDQAIKAFDKAIELDSENHYVLRGRGWTYLVTGNREQAICDLSEAVQYIDATDEKALQEALRGLGWAYYYQNNFKEAIEQFSRLIEDNLTREQTILQDVFRGLGWSYYHQNDFDKALENFDLALENTDPNNKPVTQEIVKAKNLIRRKGKSLGARIFPTLLLPGSFTQKRRSRLRRLASIIKQRLTFISFSLY